MEQLPDSVGGFAYSAFGIAGIIRPGSRRDQGVIFHISSAVLPLGEIGPKIPNHLFFASKFFIKLNPGSLFIGPSKSAKTVKRVHFTTFTHQLPFYHDRRKAIPLFTS